MIFYFPVYIQAVVSFNKHLPFKRVNLGKRNQKHISNDTESFKKNISKKADMGQIISGRKANIQNNPVKQKPPNKLTS